MWYTFIDIASEKYNVWRNEKNAKRGESSMNKKWKMMALMGLAATGMMASAVSAEGSYKIGICQLTQHEALEEATKGFQDYVSEKLGDQVTFDVQNASGELSNCVTVINAFVSEDVDLILANSTPVLQAAASATDSIPVLGTSVTDYPAALDLDNWTGVTGSNVSGTSDCAPLQQQAEMVMELIPDAKEIGILYCSAEPNSRYQTDIIESSLEELGCTAEVKEYTFTGTDDIASVTTTAAENCDVIYIPTDNTAASNAELINNICEPAEVPVICGEKGVCEGCGIATLTIDYYELGQITGEMAVDILENGADVSQMAVRQAEQVKKCYVPERCEKLGISIPDDYDEL